MAPTPPTDDGWKTALFTVRTQVADYEREGASAPGRQKRAARLRASRLALRAAQEEHAGDVAALTAALAALEALEMEEQAHRLSGEIRELLHAVDGMLAVAVEGCSAA